jgi:hypothetical protein
VKPLEKLLITLTLTLSPRGKGEIKNSCFSNPPRPLGERAG